MCASAWIETRIFDLDNSTNWNVSNFDVNKKCLFIISLFYQYVEVNRENRTLNWWKQRDFFIDFLVNS